ncbi:hypothetical protein [Clostridium brassicae]|uniref:Uncharacterized protein n=1 Tax=Clostridium brassicae TaxID=2999072 RepID=A0ABT4D6X4_9CLOT|nr:hypothetical protein [Clostridium brassicae]MCY6957923.1 hypothetical protein [Clostridium brassicae]
MKKIIIAYITGVINSYTKELSRLQKNGIAYETSMRYKAIISGFNDLLDFVEDLQEESDEPITVVLNSKVKQREI